MKMVAWIALVIAAAVMAVRVTAPTGLRLLDFGVEDAAAMAWVAGENIYDNRRLDELWRSRGHVWGGPEGVAVPSVLPPTTPALMAPLALLPPAVAGEAWLAGSVVLVVLASRAAGEMAGLRWGEPRSLLLLAAALALGPVQTGLRSGQPAIPAVCLAVIGARCALGGRRPGWGGVWMALATALKPQVGLMFIGYCVYRRQWRAAWVAAAVLVAVTSVAVGRLEWGGSPWVRSWGENLRLVFEPGAWNDYTEANRDRDHLVNLQAAIYPLVRSRTAATVGAWVIGIGLGAAWLVVAGRAVGAGRGRAEGRELLALGSAVAISLLPVYHRYYDLTVLVLLMAWVAAAWAGAQRPHARMVAGLMVPLLAPVGWQTNLLRKGWIPQWVGEARWWDIVVMPLFAWLLLLVCVVTLWAMARAGAAGCVACEADGVEGGAEAGAAG